jgi:hypothetical protein
MGWFWNHKAEKMESSNSKWKNRFVLHQEETRKGEPERRNFRERGIESQ